MTPTEFRAALASLDWSQRGLSVYLGLSSHTTVRRWSSGRCAVPAAVAEWLSQLAEAHDAAPYPAGWTK